MPAISLLMFKRMSCHRISNNTKQCHLRLIHSTCVYLSDKCDRLKNHDHGGRDSIDYAGSENEAATNFAKFATIEVSTQKDKMLFMMPNINFGDLTRTGRPAVWRICRQMDVFRLFTLRDHELKKSSETFPRVSVVIASKWKFLPHFYNSISLTKSLLGQSQMKAVGPSSMLLEIKLSDRDTNADMITNERILTYLDLGTRKKAPVPQNLQETFSHLPVVTKEDRVNIEPPSKFIFSQATTVQHGDCDLLMHCNQSSYFRFCMEAAAEATAQKLLRNFKLDLFLYDVKSIDCVYKSESKAGQLLSVDVWEDHDYSLGFLIRSPEGNTIFLAMLAFYPKDSIINSKL